MKKRNAVRVILALVVIGLVVGAYYYFTVQKRASVEDAVELTEVQKVITKDLDANYPATPREVVKYYNRIVKCFYNETYTEDELYELGIRQESFSTTNCLRTIREKAILMR